MLPFTLLLTPNSSGLFSLLKAEFLLALVLLGQYSVLCCMFHSPFQLVWDVHGAAPVLG